jgi:hypothetical protein
MEEMLTVRAIASASSFKREACKRQDTNKIAQKALDRFLTELRWEQRDFNAFS